jgi:hypothetical protein
MIPMMATLLPLFALVLGLLREPHADRASAATMSDAPTRTTER